MSKKLTKNIYELVEMRKQGMSDDMYCDGSLEV